MFIDPDKLNIRLHLPGTRIWPGVRPARESAAADGRVVPWGRRMSSGMTPPSGGSSIGPSGTGGLSRAIH